MITDDIRIRTRGPGTGSRWWWLDEVGPVSGLRLESPLPGRPGTLSCLVATPPSIKTGAFDPGRTVEVLQGLTCFWTGTLSEPVPEAGGWRIQASTAP